MSVKSLVAPSQSRNSLLIVKLVLLTIVVGLGFAIYAQWNTFVATTMDWQKELHSMLASHISAVSEDVFKYGGALVALSFVYGVFHAVGPGHGKAVIVTYLGTNKRSSLKGIFISFSAAILQALIAITLVSGLARLLKFRMADVHNYGNDMAQVSYVLVILLGVMLLIGAIKRILKQGAARHEKRDLQDISHSHNINDHPDHSHCVHNHVHSHKHDHASDCGCSHAHVPEKNESFWQTLTVILSMGFRPCSGAIVVLIYAHLIGVYSYGVMATLMMGIGTGLSVSLVAIVTLYARAWIEKFVTGGSSEHSYHVFSHYARGLGGIVLIALGWSFYSAASTLSAGHPLF